MRITLLLAFSLTVGLAAADGRTYYADPAKGSLENDGSATKPWPALAETVQVGKLAALKAGDSLLLRSGKHGAVQISGDNAGMVLVAAEKGQTPQLARLVVQQGANWTFRGLSISPAFGEAYSGNMVSLGEGGPSHDLVLEDSFVHSTLDTAAWTAEQWMKANSGVNMGRHGTRITVRNNHILNTRFGLNISSFEALVEGNIISDFSADGIRATRDGAVVQYNVIKNCYVSSGDGDKNHDDGIQAFLFNKGTGTVRNIAVRGNVLVNREDPQQRFPASMQGIGFFDGPLIGFTIADNVVVSAAWHGIALYDAQACTITGNTVLTQPGTEKCKSWIMLGTKPKVKAAPGNTVSGNQAASFKLKDDGEVKAEKNVTVTDESFDTALKMALTEIDKRFGGKHPVSGQVRLARIQYH